MALSPTGRTILKNHEPEPQWSGRLNPLHALLFALDPETSHELAVTVLARASRRRFWLRLLARMAPRPPALPVRIMGFDLPHPVGLAAGFDKDARCFPALGALGFSFVEVGTVTPRPQPGNPKKRLFRLREDRAIINRMGFNSGGIESAAARLSALPRYGPLGVNLGKNASTSLEHAIDDYVLGLRRCYPLADYFALNVSSPNTPGLRTMQHRGYLDTFLGTISNVREECAIRHGRRVPVALKIAPDLQAAELADIARAALGHGIDAIIATNTTLARDLPLRSPLAAEAGGLSGAPLHSRSTACIRDLYSHLRGRIPIIGVGGVFSAEDAWETLTAGADALQVYTGFVYRGPRIVVDIVRGLCRRMAQLHAPDLATAVKAARPE